MNQEHTRDAAYRCKHPLDRIANGVFLLCNKLPAARVRWLCLGVAGFLTVSAGVPAQVASHYAVKVSGTWVQHSGSGTKPLVSLGRVAANATLELTQGSATDTTLFFSIRNPRTLGLATLRCGVETPCRGRIAVSALKFERSGPEGGRVVEGLYHDLGSDEALRSRIRLVGARGDGREFGILVLALKDGAIDLSELRQRAGAGASAAVVRFCNLDADSGWEDCLESRQLLPGDCSLEANSCTVNLAPGAYRADLYDRDRRMLRSVPRGVGFAAIVAPNKLDAAVVARDSVEGTLLRIGKSLSPEELRALQGAAVRSLAASSR